MMAAAVPDITFLHPRGRKQDRGNWDFSCSSFPFHQENTSFTQSPLTGFSLNPIWQNWIPWTPVAIRDTGQVSGWHFSHCHQKLALPGRGRTVTGPTSTMSDTQRLEAESFSHFGEHVPFTPQHAVDIEKPFSRESQPTVSNISALFLKEQVKGCQEGYWWLWN